MPEDWLRVNLVIAVLVTVLAISVVSLGVMMSSDDDFDTLMEGPAFCWLPSSVMLTVLCLGFLASYIPYRGRGRRSFEMSLEDVEARLEMYLESQGLKFEKDVRWEQVRKSRDHWDTYTFTSDGPASILVRGREKGSSTMLLVAPWPPNDPGFIEGLERAILT